MTSQTHTLTGLLPAKAGTGNVTGNTHVTAQLHNQRLHGNINIISQLKLISCHMICLETGIDVIFNMLNTMYIVPIHDVSSVCNFRISFLQHVQ